MFIFGRVDVFAQLVGRFPELGSEGFLVGVAVFGHCDQFLKIMLLSENLILSGIKSCSAEIW